MDITKEKKFDFTFIDLFAGIGGFHQAMTKLGGHCLFASELQPELQELYYKNFGIKCTGDINKVDIDNEIKKHDLLCAGFPCQPFSKAGKRQGFHDEKDRGNLFWKILEILEKKTPEFLLLENVQNLQTHDNGNTWDVIKTNLSTLYDVQCEILSPHNFGIPQHRNRIYIVGRLKSKGGLKDFTFPKGDNPTCNIKKIINENDTDFMTLRPQTRMHLEVWQEFLNILTKNNISIPTFPIWSMEFGATYKYDTTPPFRQHIETLRHQRGAFGELIDGNSKDDMLAMLPIYAQSEKVDKDTKQFPDWKKNYIKQNREFYEKYKKYIDPWIPLVRQNGFENSHQKFEWNCGYDKDAKPILDDKIIQFRPSGIRVKLPTYSPALVLTTTQIPIFPWVKVPNSKLPGRYMTKQEAAKLQCMEDLPYYPDTIAKAFKAFGNAVNVEVVRRVAENLLSLK